jgi:dUTP pyrophosphatase
MSFAKIPVKVRRLEAYKGELPMYQSPGSSGFDVRAQIDSALTLQPGQILLVPTALSFEIPPGYELQARPRSGLAAKHGIGIVNAPGTIDSDYRGEVKIILTNLSHTPFVINPGERIAQLVLAPVVQASFEMAEELSDALAGIDDKRCMAQIGENDFNFATVVRVDRSGRINDSNAVFCGQTTSRSRLQFISWWNFETQCCWHEQDLARLKSERRIDLRPHVKSARSWRLVHRQFALVCFESSHLHWYFRKTHFSSTSPMSRTDT